MTGRRFALLVGAAFAVMFVALNMIANVWLRDARLDLTENRLYTLSQGSKTVLSGLAEPLELRFYYSREAAGADPALSAYAARVRELLLSYAANADGMVRVVEVNPEPDSEEEDAARLAGLQPLEPPGQDPIFLGLAGANAVDDRQAIAFLDPEREPFLEYDLTRLIYDLDNPNPPRIGLITTMPMGDEPNLGQGGEVTANLFGSQLRGLFEVEALSPDFTTIPDDIDVLAVIHPWGLSPGQLYAIDQFALSKGRLLVAVDPASLLALTPPSADPFAMMAPPAPSSSNLAPLLSAWGLELSSDVVMDREGGFVLGGGPGGSFTFPLFLQVPADRLSRTSLITAELTGDTVFGMAGALQVSEREGLTAETLARTTGETMRIPAEFALQQPSPDMIDQMWQPTARTEILAVQLTGRLTSAFATGAPPEAGLGDQSARLTATPEGQSAQIVVVGDTDFLLDGFYFQQGQLIFDNLFFALNTVEALSGSEALISLRSRAPSTRRLTVLDEMEEQARADFQASLEAAESEQAATEQRLRELQSRGQGSGFLDGEGAASLTPEEQSEINRFMTNAQALRDQVRDIRRDLRRATDSLQGWVVGLNLWVAPLLVGAVGVVVLTRRNRRQSQRREEAKA
jgi:ABC-type uncharacterized transport system involved in gliding motility auxiliary subunit